MSKLENETAVAEKSSRSSRTLLLILGLMVFEAAGIFGVIEWMRPSHVQADGFAQDITFAPNELVEVVVYEEANQRKGTRRGRSKWWPWCPHRLSRNSRPWLSHFNICSFD